jgi:ribosomal protein S12 methylthiotransferase accessory factor YcaO
VSCHRCKGEIQSTSFFPGPTRHVAIETCIESLGRRLELAQAEMRALTEVLDARLDILERRPPPEARE